MAKNKEPECNVKRPLGMNNNFIIYDNSKYVIPFSVIINPSLGRDTRVENRGHRSCMDTVDGETEFFVHSKMGMANIDLVVNISNWKLSAIIITCNATSFDGSIFDPKRDVKNPKAYTWKSVCQYD